MIRPGMRADSVTHRLYAAVKAAGPLGVNIGTLCEEFTDSTRSSVENTLWRLRVSGFIAHHRQSRAYMVDASCREPEILYPQSPRGQLLALIGDCEAGISTELLCRESEMSPEKVLRVLGDDIAGGRVKCITMPETHGGGSGFVLCPDATPAQRVPPKKLAAAVAAAEPTLAEGTEGRCQFKLLQTQQFVITWGEGFEVKLPRDVTRSMLRFFDQVGGLSIAQRLQIDEGGAS